MSAIILDGRKTREALMPELISRVKTFSFAPILAIIQVGDRPDSSSYIRAKESFAKKIGVECKIMKVSDAVSQQEIIEIVKECNADKSIKGIIVQLPLPISLDRDTIINTIDPHKDVDGLTPFQVKAWSQGREDAVLPATARGVRQLLKQYDISLFGKRVTVVGRSMLVGKPIISMCLNENATVTVCHSKTEDLAFYTKKADILIVAAGKPGLIQKKHTNKKQIVVDVGINTVGVISGESDRLGYAGGSKLEKLENEIEGKKLVGDVDFDKIQKSVAAITPVPGGVGPMTVLSLFENLLDLCETE